MNAFYFPSVMKRIKSCFNLSEKNSCMHSLFYPKTMVNFWFLSQYSPEILIVFIFCRKNMMAIVLIKTLLIGSGKQMVASALDVLSGYILP